MGDVTKEKGLLASFMDNLWLQLAIGTVITVVWLIWIFYEIWIKAPPI